MPHPLRVAVQMDPIETVNIDSDSTFALLIEAQTRGHDLWHYEVRNLSWQDGRLSARARPLSLRCQRGDHYTLGEPETLDLAEVDVVLMRQDPPFDLAYITATHLLELIHPRTLVVNNPAAVRNAPEKLLITRFPELLPPTLIAWDGATIRAFRAQYRDIVVKPLFGNGGAGVFHLGPEDENLGALLEMHFARSREPLMVQHYVAEVKEGDKRIVLIDGEPMGAINRRAPPGEARSNLHIGGRAEAATLSARDRKICACLGPMLREQGLLFVGIDVIGPYLTEINVTSPTGLQEIRRFDGSCLEGAIWDRIESQRR